MACKIVRIGSIRSIKTARTLTVVGKKCLKNSLIFLFVAPHSIRCSIIAKVGVHVSKGALVG